MTTRRKWPPSVETFMAALTPEEAVRWKAFRVALTSPETDLKAVEADFVVWAEPIVRRLGGGSVGAVWNPFKVRYSPEQPTEVQPLAELADRFPYPLGLKLSEVVRASRRRAEGEPEPQFAFEICATFGVLLRFAALVVIRGYVDAGSRDAELNRYIVATLRRPSDGSWLEISRRLAGDAGHVPMVRVIRDALAFEPRLPPAMRSRLRGTRKTSAALQELVEFRNTLMHGVVPAAEALDGAEALLELVIRGFEGLGDYLLYVRHEGRVWEFEGAAPRLVAGWEALPEGEPCLVRRVGDEAPLSLSPLLRFRAGVPGGSPVATSDHFDPAWEGEGFAVEFDELFFLNAGSKEELRYIGFGSSSVLDGRTLQSYEDFKAFLARIPTPAVVPNDRIDFTNLAAFHADLFVGRAAVLDELHTFVRERRAPYLVLPALAGMGKTAIMARLWEEHASTEPVAAGDRWVFHFCMSTSGRGEPTVALRSLIAQVCDAFGLPRREWLSNDIDELKSVQLPALLAEASGRLGPGERLVVVIDALDEGIGVGGRSIPGCLPAAVPDGVVFVVSYRADAAGRSARVEKHLARIPVAHRATLATASPLEGLARPDVAVFLAKFGGEGVAPETEEAVWQAATLEAPSADPFYLRFVAAGVLGSTIRLERTETVPASSDDALEEVWMRLPTDHDFLIHHVLLHLAVMREYGDDELFAALLNRERGQERRLTTTDVAAVRVMASGLLIYDGDRYGLYHSRLRRFLVGTQERPIPAAAGRPD